MSAYISWKDGFFRFDAVVQENHVLDAEITTHPVEKGTDISDNVRLAPRVCTVTGIISQAPVYSLDLSLQPTNPLDLFSLDRRADPGDINRPPSTQKVTPPQPPIAISLNGAFNALDAFISGTSFSLQTATAALDTEPRTGTYQTYQTSSNTDYIAQAYGVLRALQQHAELVTVFGGGGLGGTPGSFGGAVQGTVPNDAGNATSMFSNMILKTINFERQQGSGGSAHFTLTFHEIRLISSSIVAAPNPTIIPNAKPVTSTGSQAGKQAPGGKVTNLYALSHGGAKPTPAPGMGVIE